MILLKKKSQKRDLHKSSLKKRQSISKNFWFLLFFIFPSALVFSQTVQMGKTVYSSELDQLLTVRKIATLPFFDNVKGIYSTPIETEIEQWIDNNHHWESVNFDLAGPRVTIDELMAKPDLVQELTQGSSADAFIIGSLIKTPNDLSIKLGLFLKSDGKMISFVEERQLEIFELNQVKEKSLALLMALLDKLPYRGIVLSRTDNRVTVNLGIADGMSPEQLITVTQVIRLIRHPRFNFIVSAEKEIIGKIKLVKVQDTLSFGKIVTEKEPGAIQKYAKISGIKFTFYGSEADGFGGRKSVIDQIKTRTDQEVSFGKNPKAWVPAKPPTFGRIGGYLHLGHFQYARARTGKSLTANNYYPGAHFDIEVWLTSKWSLHGHLGFGITSLGNPLNGSSPNELSLNYSLYEMLVGYNIRMGDNIWGTRIELLLGLTNNKLVIDDSNPVSFTTTEYKGVPFGFYGQHPLGVFPNWFIAGKFLYVISPDLSESIEKSGHRDDNEILRLEAMGIKKYSESLRLDFGLRFSMNNTTFKAELNAKSISQKQTTIFTGLSYLF